MSKRLAVQMYTVREFTKTEKDFARTLKKIAKIGYSAVQVSAVGCINDGSISAAAARKMLDDNGLKCVATHRSLDNFINNVQAEIEFHHALGCSYAAIGGMSYPLTIAAYRRFCSDTTKFTEKLKAAGILFGYHNHAREFFRPRQGQPRLYDILIDEGGADMHLEMDLFWIWHGGESPAKMIKRGKGRVSVIHLKDKAFYPGENNQAGIAPIGEGNMPWEEIIPVCKKNGVKWYCIEHDVCPRDPFDCLRSSYEYLKQNFGLE